MINTRKTLIEERQEQHGTHVEIIDCLTSGEAMMTVMAIAYPII